MIYAVIDTNVLVSALLTKNSSSPTVVILNKVLTRVITPLYCQEIIDEYLDVLSREAFHFDTKEVTKLIENIQILGEDIQHRIPYSGNLPDEDDRVFFEVSLSHQGSYLITGNSKHFPKTPTIITPAEMLALISSGD